jgi:2-succinyl-6-hydroxy-2,4-cyclohexadiene-1-carboxylate synthase
MIQLSQQPISEIQPGIAGRIEPGEGDKVLWLHGYTLDSSSWGEMWRRLPGWQHIGIDLPGHGASEPMSGEGDLRDLGRRFGEYCLREDIRHIVALSFGTITAIQIAIQYPDAFDSLVLGAPSLAGGPQDQETGAVYMKLYELYHRVGPGLEMRDLWMTAIAWKGVEKVAGLRESLGGLVARHSWAELGGFAMRKQFTRPPHTEEDLRRIGMPVLILVGDQELPAFRQCADILARALPRSEHRVLPDTGHLCMLQSPDLSARWIEAHLRAHARKPPAVVT